jgi:hypothetical protein
MGRRVRRDEGGKVGEARRAEGCRRGEIKTGGIKPRVWPGRKGDAQLALGEAPIPRSTSPALKSGERGQERQRQRPTSSTSGSSAKWTNTTRPSPRRRGPVKAFKLYITDDTGTDRFYGNFPEEARAELLAYAKKKGVEGRVKLGPVFNAKADNVDQSKELEVPKDLMDWVADMGLENEARAEAPKAAKEMFGDEPTGDPEKELFAGLPVPKSVREKAAKFIEKFDVEAMFNRLKAKATGLSVKLYHTRKNREFELAEDAIKNLKAVAKKVNRARPLLPVSADLRPGFPPPSPLLTTPARLGPTVGLSAVLRWCLRASRPASSDPWPLSAIRRMRAELQDYRERVARGARNSDALKEKITERERAIKFLETTGMRYVHIPRYWLEAFFNARPEQAPKVLSELFGQRETLDIEWLADRLVGQDDQPADLDVGGLCSCMLTRPYKVALGQSSRTRRRRAHPAGGDAPET